MLAGIRKNSAVRNKCGRSKYSMGSQFYGAVSAFDRALAAAGRPGGGAQAATANTRQIKSNKKGTPAMTIESILRRRAFRDGFHDGRRGCPMRRLATRRARWLYALGRIFANVAPAEMRIYERRQVTEAAVAAFAAMPARY